MQRMAVFVVFVVFVLTTLNCNACYEVPSIRKGTKVVYYNKSRIEREQELLQHIVDRTVLVEIRCRRLDPVTLSPVSKLRPVGWGTGVILASTSGVSYIQTALHVVANAKLVMRDGALYDCSTIYFYRYNLDNTIRDVYKDKYQIEAYSKGLDVAIITVDCNYGVSTHVATRPLLGQEIRVVGFPALRGVKGSNLAVERGVIGSVGIVSEGKKIKRPIRVAAFVYFGNSGGGVWSITGELVGTINYMVGWGLFGVFITQQNNAYGVGSDTLRIFYSQKRLNILLW